MDNIPITKEQALQEIGKMINKTDMELKNGLKVHNMKVIMLQRKSKEKVNIYGLMDQCMKERGMTIN